MLQQFAMVKYGVFVAKICKHALCVSTVRDIWWSPLARQLLPPCSTVITRVAQNHNNTINVTESNYLHMNVVHAILGTPMFQSIPEI